MARMLPLWFARPEDYDLISGSDKLTIHDLKNLTPGKPVKITGKRADGSEYEFEVTHTVSFHVSWPRAAADLNSSTRARLTGSALAPLLTS